MLSSLCLLSLCRFLPAHVAGERWWEWFGAAFSAQLSAGVKRGFGKLGGYIMLPSSDPRIFCKLIVQHTRTKKGLSFGYKIDLKDQTKSNKTVVHSKLLAVQINTDTFWGKLKAHFLQWMCWSSFQM